MKVGLGEAEESKGGGVERSNESIGSGLRSELTTMVSSGWPSALRSNWTVTGGGWAGSDVGLTAVGRGIVPTRVGSAVMRSLLENPVSWSSASWLGSVLAAARWDEFETERRPGRGVGLVGRDDAMSDGYRSVFAFEGGIARHEVVDKIAMGAVDFELAIGQLIPVMVELDAYAIIAELAAERAHDVGVDRDQVRVVWS